MNDNLKNSKYILVSRQLLEDVLEDLYELREGRAWWKDEIKCGYQRRYESLCSEIITIEEILKAEDEQQKTNE